MTWFPNKPPRLCAVSLVFDRFVEVEEVRVGETRGPSHAAREGPGHHPDARSTPQRFNPLSHPDIMVADHPDITARSAARGRGNPPFGQRSMLVQSGVLISAGQMIVLDNVVKQFEGKQKVTALSGVTLNIQKGEMVSIGGPSGSGKSTLLNMVGALDRPSSGKIHIDGQLLSGLGDDDLTRLRRDKIGFVFQFFNLLPTLTAMENVCLPLHLRGWSRGKAQARARELLDLTGLGKRGEHLPEELSGGERQRVAIARALSIYPPILLGDEPTGNLDTATGTEILGLLQDLHTRLGSTVVIVTHDPGVSAICPRMVRMRDGEIVEDVRQ